MEFIRTYRGDRSGEISALLYISIRLKYHLRILQSILVRNSFTMPSHSSHMPEEKHHVSHRSSSQHKKKSSSSGIRGVFGRRRNQQTGGNSARGHNDYSQESNSNALKDYLLVLPLVTKSFCELQHAIETLQSIGSKYKPLSGGGSVGKNIRRAIRHMQKAQDTKSDIENEIMYQKRALKRSRDDYDAAHKQALLSGDLDYVAQSSQAIYEMVERYKNSEIGQLGNHPMVPVHKEAIKRLEEAQWAISNLVGEMNEHNTSVSRVDNIVG
jgi:hypothetical protein